MYTGIVEQIGIISALQDSQDGRRLDISPSQPMSDLKLGDSINISGCCFTVVELSSKSFAVQASHETLRRSKLGLLKIDDSVNLERPLKLGYRLGGHLVSGHVDTTAAVSAIDEQGFSKVITFTLSINYLPFFVEKGSVTVDGVSLTVFDCEKDTEETCQFSVALIPYTMQITTLGKLAVGETVNIETDLIAKYLARWLSLGNQFNMSKLFAAINAGATDFSDSQLKNLKKEQVSH